MTDDVIAQGLEGIVVSESAVGRVNATENYYQYRHYDAVILNNKRSYEDVWYLMLFGHLPSKSEAGTFKKRISSCVLTPALNEIMRAHARKSDPEAMLRLMIAMVSTISSEEGFQAVLDINLTQARDNVIHLCAVAPLVLSGLYRLSNNQEPIPPRNDQSFAWNYLYMLSGNEPDKDAVWAIERYLISVIDHGFNASTFTSRVIASTGTDVGSAMAGAIGSLSGPLHGGAPSRVLDMLDEIGSPDRIAAWVRQALDSNAKIMGFGHRVYKNEDPRSELMKSVAKRMDGKRVDLAIAAEKEILSVLEEVKSGRKICTNVEFFSSVVMEACGLPRALFTPTFMVARMIGWGAHILEQIDNNRIYRPRSKYTGLPYTDQIPEA